FPVNAWPDWSALSALSKSKGWDMCHSFLIVYYWNDTEFLTLPIFMLFRLNKVLINILRHSRRFF
ncbi:hypothetical protein DB011_00270, partial [Salmonella enterica subsp. enterica serovar Weltevreden]